MSDPDPKKSVSLTLIIFVRLRYLRHLPVASSFEVAELELEEPVVSKVLFLLLYVSVMSIPILLF